MEIDAIRFNQLVLIEDNIIKSITPAGSIPVPKNAKRIPARGKFLMPGLMDMHVHIGFSINRHGIENVAPSELDKATQNDLFLFLAHGVTTVRNMQGGPYHLKLKQQSSAGLIPAPRIFTAGPMVDGRPSWPGGHRILMPGADVRQFVENYLAEGYDFIKSYSGLTDDIYIALLQEGNRAGGRVVGHIPNNSTIETALKYGQDSIEHLMGLDGVLQPEGIVVKPGYFPFRDWPSIDPNKVPTWSKRLAASEVWITPTLTVLTSLYDKTDIPKVLQQSEMALVSCYRKTIWQTAPHYLHATADMLATIRHGNTNRRVMVNALHKAGASLMLGSDASVAFMIPGKSTLDELKNMVAAGLTPYQALQAATRMPAAYLGYRETLGVIKEGALADLILLDANPFNDIDNLNHIEGVIKNGDWYSKKVIRAKLLAIKQWNNNSGCDN